ncbi:unnamed protein product [Haemonchus placei]|uniref:Uncharacterized protein n=1 Tax=Haemonchus placei TaxID=6290 RepID=A0A3P8A719_HAEPC|nr:unnamed protein product [Haemonchus placei]
MHISWRPQFIVQPPYPFKHDFIPVNETRVCAAYLCIKVVVHAGIDDDNVFQQGISSRCGYTGGDRAACSRIDGCTSISVYDGMTGNCNNAKVAKKTRNPAYIEKHEVSKKVVK